MPIQLRYQEQFENRHHGKSVSELQEMLDVLNVKNLDELIARTIPASIRLSKALDLPNAQSEHDFLRDFKKLAQKNQIFKSYIGLGYYDCVTPNVILRNVLENPAWYTAYTPYQAEIAQGRLEALINYQTMVIDLTGMEIANASLLDEGTAAAEAASLLYAARPKSKKDAHFFFASELCLPQTLEILKTRLDALGIELQIGKHNELDLFNPSLFGILLQYPAANGEVFDYTNLIQNAKLNDLGVVVAADLLALTLLKEPAKMGADVAIGTTQRFGVPMGFGGPHAAYFATKDEYKRLMAGRIIGLSKDATGKNAYRMALQTREQHIKREKATSNICTAQVLLSVMAGAYAVYHGADGLKKIAERVHGLTDLLAKALTELGFRIQNKYYFDTLTIEAKNKKQQNAIRHIATIKEVNFRYFNENLVGISLNETTNFDDVVEILEIFGKTIGKELDKNKLEDLAQHIEGNISDNLKRETPYLTHPVFNSYHTEHEMLRYLKYLENKDLSLVHSMISLGSCTMKLNATAEMIPVTWSEFGKIHPFAPKDQVKGYLKMCRKLEKWLSEITGFTAVSLQPNSGAQGEYAGLMVIRAYHQDRNENHRQIALIPTSAHGTNPASAVMVGMKVVLVACDEKGNIDVNDLKQKAEQHSENLAALLVTYPSTHGVFEESIQEICEIIHQNGGLVYMDGANMNAQVGLTNPATIGADVCHLNLHKTFCIPHGGGGPGMGPIGVNDKLANYLPNHLFQETGGEKGITAVSAAPFGSASILTISYAYIAMMGSEGLTNATKMAILNANYIKNRLEKYYPILYTGTKGRAAHEMIVDMRQFKKVGVEVEDIAKRLMDYGFHAPTVSFPVAGTLMIEPTESESKAELDRFCDALIEIRNEIAEIENGVFDQKNNVLKNAPHTAEVVLNDNWDKPYSRQKAAYPLEFVRKAKFWASVSRIDSAYGDRNLICSCVPVEEYAENLA